MTTTQALQSLQDDFKKVAEQSKSTQAFLQQLRNAKKEADIQKKRHEVLASLRSAKKIVAELQEHVKDSEEWLEDVLGEKIKVQTQEQEAHKEKTEPKVTRIEQTHKLTPEQQEARYELKATRMEATKSQNQALKGELQLQQKKKQVADTRHSQAQSYPGSETLRAAHALEAKLRGANLKIKGLEEELRKSQQMTLKYKELYENSARESEQDTKRNSPAQKSEQDTTRNSPAQKSEQNTTRNSPAQKSEQNTTRNSPAQKSEQNTTRNSPAQKSQSPDQARSKSAPRLKPAPVEQQSFVGPNTSVNDLVRKNECLLEENEIQRQEIQRLKRDNAHLLLAAKSASTDKHTICARLGTSESARQDLHKRFEKLKNENSQLNRSYTKQASEWLEMKKQHQYLEDQERWKGLSPVAPHGGRDRWFDHTGRKNTDHPRQMYPVENYTKTSVT